MQTQQLTHQGLLKTTQINKMTQQPQQQQYVVILDRGSCVLKAIIELRKKGVFVIKKR